MSTGAHLTIAALIADDDVQALVEDTTTSPTSYNVVPLVRDQEVQLNAIVVQNIAGVPMTSLAGDTSGLDRGLVQIDCMAQTPDEAHALAVVVRAALATQPKVFFPAATPRDDYSDTTATYVVSLDYHVWVRRT